MATSPGQARQRPNRHRCLRRAQKKSCSRDDTGAGVSSAGGISLSASGKRRTKFPQSRVRGTHPKLRQREQQEIRELEDRICVEMPLPGLCWTPPVLSTCEGRTPVNASSGSPEEDTTRRQLKEVSTHQTAKPATRDQEEAPKDRNEGGMEGRGNVSTSTDEGQDATERIEQAGVPVLSKFFFSDLPLSGYTRRGLQEAGFHRLSSIQFRVIPHALRGADVLGEAKTGSGKTLCFVVPVLECLYRHRVSNVDGLSALVLVPTRELAVQIFDVFKVVGRHHEFSAGCLIGGKSVTAEAHCVNLLNIIVGTPGRVLQHMEESPLWEASGLRILVVDEADRLVDMGFMETTRLIVERLPSDRTTLLFSATLKSAVKRLGYLVTSDAETISVAADVPATPLTLKQSFMVVPAQHKLSALFSFLRAHNLKKILVFVSSCKQARFLYETFRLLKPGLRLMYLHGRQRQQKRLEVFESFVRRPGACCLISTDLASRGIDFTHVAPSSQKKKIRGSEGQRPGNASFSRESETELCRKESKREKTGGPRQTDQRTEESTSVDFVVQMDCPDSVDTYIHRVGRTARMQRKGRALLMLLPSEQLFVSRLKEKKIELEQLYLNPSFALKIENKLQALLAENTELKCLAQRALASYLRCIALMPDKSVFSLPKETRSLTLLSNGYGLSLPPTVRILHGSGADEESDAAEQGTVKKEDAAGRRKQLNATEDTQQDICVHGGAVAVTEMKQRKNLTKLERLKEKIRQKKAEKEARRRAAEDSSAKEPGRSVTVDSAEEGAESATRREGGPSQVADGDRAGLREQDEALGRNEAEDERRKRSGDEETEGSREGKDKADFFSFKDANEGDQGHEASQGGRQMKNILLHEQLLRKPVYRRERLKFRADGTAKVKGLAVASLQQGHFFFGEEDDEKEENTEAADGGAGQAAAGREEDVVSADEKKTSRGGAGEQEETEMVGGAMLHRAEPARRQAFLERVRQKVQAVQEADKDRNRQRVHERHALKRQKERASRKADAAERNNHGGPQLISDGEERDSSPSTSSGDVGDAENLGSSARGIKWKKKECSSFLPDVQGSEEEDDLRDGQRAGDLHRRDAAGKIREKRTRDGRGKEGREAARRKKMKSQESSSSLGVGDENNTLGQLSSTLRAEDLEKMALKVLQG